MRWLYIHSRIYFKFVLPNAFPWPRVTYVSAKDSELPCYNCSLWSTTLLILHVLQFKLDYPSEYITTVEGFWDKTSGNERGVITRLRFTTNKQTFRPVGLESTTSFSLGKEGYKIVGFHGNSSTDKLHQLGVYVVPITREWSLPNLKWATSQINAWSGCLMLFMFLPCLIL